VSPPEGPAGLERGGQRGGALSRELTAGCGTPAPSALPGGEGDLSGVGGVSVGAPDPGNSAGQARRAPAGREEMVAAGLWGRAAHRHAWGRESPRERQTDPSHR